MAFLIYLAKMIALGVSFQEHRKKAYSGRVNRAKRVEGDTVLGQDGRTRYVALVPTGAVLMRVCRLNVVEESN